jgi:DNA-directed RNA polymerase specialized sigma subunit, sigma24 homolog
MSTTFPMLITLNAEWGHLDLGCGSELARWSATEPALAGCVRLAAVLEAGRDRPDEVFAALLRLGSQGSVLAHRVVLQAMLGLLVRLAKGRPAAFEELVGEAWLLIAEYPLARRPHSIVANLAWALRRYPAGEARQPLIPVQEWLAPPPTAEPEPDAAHTLATAHRLGLIDQLTHQTLVSVYLVGNTSAEAGRELGLSAEAVRWRCSHALRNLHRQAALLAG